jgi:hypothetical protein
MSEAVPSPICIHGMYWLQAGRSGDRFPVGARYSTPVQTGPGVHPAPYKMGIGLFPGVSRPRHAIVHPLPRSPEVKERVELYRYSSSGPS